MSARSDGSGKLTLDDIRPYLVNAKQKGSQIIADCPICQKQGHLYVSEKGKLNFVLSVKINTTCISAACPLQCCEVLDG